MAKGYIYHEERETYVPSRPSRRRDSNRIVSDRSYYEHSSRKNTSYQGGHYAESPIIMPQAERTLEIVSSEGNLRRSASDGMGLDKHHSSRRSSTLPAGERSIRSRSRQERKAPTVISKVTRSRSLTSRPAGIPITHSQQPYNKLGGSKSSHIYPIEKAPSRPGTRMSSKSGRSHATSAPGKNTTKAGVVVETMSAPNPFCPNTKGVCCLMILVNLALILVAIGFIIVLQLPEPEFVWNIGVVILVFGFVTFFVALVYCSCICQESAHIRAGQQNQGELYWTHHWQKNITIPEIQTKNKDKWEEQDRFPEDDLSDTSSRDYPRLYLESDYGQRTDREADFETEQELGGHHSIGGKSDNKYSSSHNQDSKDYRGRH